MQPLVYGPTLAHERSTDLAHLLKSSEKNKLPLHELHGDDTKEGYFRNLWPLKVIEFPDPLPFIWPSLYPEIGQLTSNILCPKSTLIHPK